MNRNYKGMNNDFFEETSGFFLENVLISKSEIKELINGRDLLKWSYLEGLATDSEHSSLDNGYLFFVLYSITYSNIRKDDRTDKRCTIWNITDLNENKCRLYLLGETPCLLKNKKIGSLYLVIKPSIIFSEGIDSKKYLSISRMEQIVEIGKVKGFSICKGINRNGSICTNPVNVTLQGSFCRYHISSKKRLNTFATNNKVLDVTEDTTNGGLMLNLKTSSFKHTDKLKHELTEKSDSKKISYRRVPKADIKMSTIEYYSANDTKSIKLGCENESNNIREFKNELNKLNKKLCEAIQDNNKSELLSILRHLSKFDTSKITLIDIVESKIIESISNLELTINELEIATFALKVRHKFCSSKGFWPGIKSKYKKKNDFEFLNSSNHMKVRWSEIYENISTKENDVTDQINEKGIKVALIDKILKKNTLVSKRFSNMEIGKNKTIFSDINNVISLETICDDAIRRLEDVNMERRLKELEEADKIEQCKRETSSIYISNATKCCKCNIWMEGSANKICMEEHPEQIIYNQRALKKIWSCKSCNHRLFSINNYVSSYCPNCKKDTTCNLEKRSIYKLRDGPEIKESLKIRDEEEKSKMKLKRSIDEI